jgi:DNA-binding NarL/FixJ family response regulator
VGQGESLLDPLITQKVLEKVRELMTRPKKPKEQELTEQEEKILALIAQGMTNKEIAQELYLSDKTVKNYVSSILEKLNLSRRAEAAAYYVRRHSRKEP